MVQINPVIGSTLDGRPIGVDLEALIQSRMLITGTSGSGKSYTIRRLVEQTNSLIQQVIIDPENEFASLKDHLEFVLIGGPDGQFPAENPALLATKLLETGASAVIGINELSQEDRIEFVREFVDTLMDAPRELWHPLMLVIDEIQMFAAQSGSSPSRKSIGRLMSQARKRGFVPILATQRLSKLDKDAAAEAGNLMIGRSSLDTDVRRSAEILGFGTGAESLNKIRSLRTGEFYCVGPALCDKVELVKVAKAVSFHPKTKLTLVSREGSPRDFELALQSQVPPQQAIDSEDPGGSGMGGLVLVFILMVMIMAAFAAKASLSIP